ncbi:hemin uptake protein HemP [Undibacterium sp. Jales W-56]|uniref:hemin uptake protein HemP n=1 Tax=Undibacterium sp. Jales W-56 TaxID=2897325 RepID=UPI0021CFB2BC|nr:hemin uptake protein HemP [Undibacterium sp. Jales W-56]MCU6432452.1 hemin uptake protein HemP [Undibacterium sp. Jales W-56]
MANFISEFSSKEKTAVSDAALTSINVAARTALDGKQIPRLKSRELMREMREVEIDHEGKIYRLRVTQLNKLILTA